MDHRQRQAARRRTATCSRGSSTSPWARRGSGCRRRSSRRWTTATTGRARNTTSIRRNSRRSTTQRRKLVGKQLYTLLGVPRGDAAGMLKQFRKNYDFFDAPVGMILCVERRMGNGQWIDCGIFLDQLMLLAREKGLHTCPQAAFSRYQHVVRRELEDRRRPDRDLRPGAGLCRSRRGAQQPDHRARAAQGFHDLVQRLSRVRPKSNCRGRRERAKTR